MASQLFSTGGRGVVVRGSTAFRVAVLAFAALGASGCGESATPWTTVRNEDAGFSVEVPGGFEAPVDSGKTSSSLRFQSIPADLPYSFVVLSSTHTMTAEQIDGSVQEAVGRTAPQSSSYSQLEAKPIERGNLRGAEQLAYKDASGRDKSFQRSLLLWSATRQYVATVESKRPADPYGPEVERFLNSFRELAREEPAK